MDRIFQYFIDKKIAAILLSSFFIVVGYQCFRLSDFEIAPDVSFPKVEIECVDYGANPENIEKSFLIPIEAAVAGIDCVKKVSSVAYISTGKVTVEVDSLKNVNRVVNDISRELERIDLPTGGNTEKPKVKRVTQSIEVLSVALSGTWKTVEKYVHEIERKLRNLDSVSKVKTIGRGPVDFFVEIPLINLKKYDVSLSQIADLIRAESSSSTLGVVNTFDDELTVGISTKKDISFYKNLKLNIKGTIVRLADLADFSQKPREEENITRFDGKRAVIFYVFGKEALKVSEDVKESLGNLELPKNIEIKIFSDKSNILQAHLNSMGISLLWSFISVLFSLLIFLGLRSAIFSSIGVVVSFLGSFIVMILADISVNRISLLAFMIVLGIVVDDAIIVSESIQNNDKKSTLRGILKVYKPVFFATMTSVVFFILLAFFEGSSGKAIRSLAVPASAVLIISLIEAFFCLPSHISHFSALKNKRPLGSKVIEKLREKYSIFLTKILEWRYVAIISFVGFAMVTNLLVSSGLVSTKSVDENTSNSLSISFFMSSDTPFEKFKSSVENIERIGSNVCSDFGNILKHTNTTILKRKNGSPLSASIIFELIDVSDREVSCSEIKEILRKKTKNIEGYVSFGGQIIDSNEIKLNFVGLDRRDLKSACKMVKDSLVGYEEILCVNDSLYEVARQINCEVSSMGKSLGLTKSDIAREVRSALFGSHTGIFYIDGEEVRIKTRLNYSDRSSMEKLYRIPIEVGDRKYILSDVANLNFVPGISPIERSNCGIIVEMNISTKVGFDGVFLRFLEDDIFPKIKSRFPEIEINFDGFIKAKKEVNDEFQKIMKIGIFIMLSMLALLFNSFTLPAIAVSSVFFAVFGAIFGHILFRLPITYMSIYGLVAMAGVAVNDSLVLINSISQNRSKHNLMKSILLGAKRRFRPIFLTTITTCVSVLPILLFDSLENRFVAPIAASLFGGILASTLAALFLIPCLIVMANDLCMVFKKIFRIKVRKDLKICRH